MADTHEAHVIPFTCIAQVASWFSSWTSSEFLLSIMATLLELCDLFTELFSENITLTE